MMKEGINKIAHKLCELGAGIHEELIQISCELKKKVVFDAAFAYNNSDRIVVWVGESEELFTSGYEFKISLRKLAEESIQSMMDDNDDIKPAAMKKRGRYLKSIGDKLIRAAEEFEQRQQQESVNA